MFKPYRNDAEILDLFQQPLDKAMDAGVAFSKATCLVDTGALQRSIRKTAQIVGAGYIRQSIITDVEHAHINEYVYKPFLRPAKHSILNSLDV